MHTLSPPRGPAQLLPLPARASLALAIGASLLAGCTSPVPLERWVEASSPHFAVLTDLPAAEAEVLARELETFRAFVAASTNVSRQDPPIPTRIVAFARARDFRKFVTNRTTAGLLKPTMRANYVALSRNRGILLSRIIRHEYVHFALRNGSTLAYPLWYDEGFAEFLSTVELDGDRMVVGAVPLDRVQALLGDLIPYRRILEASSYRDFRSWDLDRFYGQSWALVHYLHFGRGKPRSVSTELTRYLDERDAGADPPIAFERAFGIDADSLDDRIREHLRAIGSFASKFESASLPTPRIRTVPPGEVAARLGDLAHVLGRERIAVSLYQRAVDTQPTSARAHAGLARALATRADWQSAAAHFERAVRLAPNDSRVRTDYGSYLHVAMERAATAVEREALLADARRHLERGRELDPDSPETHARYGWTWLYPLSDPERGLEALFDAYELLRSDPELNLMLATALVANDRDDEARTLLTRVFLWIAGHASGMDQGVDAAIEEIRNRLAEGAR